MKRKEKEGGRGEIEFSIITLISCLPNREDIHQGLGHVLATYSCRLNLLPGSSLKQYTHNSLAIST